MLSFPTHLNQSLSSSLRRYQADQQKCRFSPRGETPNTWGHIHFAFCQQLSLNSYIINTTKYPSRTFLEEKYQLIFFSSTTVTGGVSHCPEQHSLQRLFAEDTSSTPTHKTRPWTAGGLTPHSLPLPRPSSGLHLLLASPRCPSPPHSSKWEAGRRDSCSGSHKATAAISTEGTSLSGPIEAGTTRGNDSACKWKVFSPPPRLPVTFLEAIQMLPQLLHSSPWASYRLNMVLQCEIPIPCQVRMSRLFHKHELCNPHPATTLQLQPQPEVTSHYRQPPSPGICLFPGIAVRASLQLGHISSVWPAWTGGHSFVRTREKMTRCSRGVVGAAQDRLVPGSSITNDGLCLLPAGPSTSNGQMDWPAHQRVT